MLGVMKSAFVIVALCSEGAAAFQAPVGSMSLRNGISKHGGRSMLATRKSALNLSMQTVSSGQKVVSPDWRLAAFTLAGAAALTAKQPVVGLPFLALGGLFAVQTNRVRFVFDDEAFSVQTAPKDESGELGSTGENIVVGGENRWKYDSWVNYDFFPSKEFPILVYFKETQTPTEKWNEGPGQLDKEGGGQIHFFPALCNVEEIDQEFKARGLPSQRYNPK